MEVGPRPGCPCRRGKGTPVMGLEGRCRGGGTGNRVLGVEVGGEFSMRGRGATICRWPSAAPGGSKGSTTGSAPPHPLGGQELGLSFQRFRLLQLLKKKQKKMEEVLVQSFHFNNRTKQR